MAPALTMAVLAPAKINLSLRVIGRRTDGYHLLQSLMVPVSLYDEVRLTVTHGDAGRIQLLCDAPGVPCGEDNLVCQAARLFLARTGVEAGLRIDLRKRIPPGSGLGGGSSDAAATLTALNRRFGTHRSAAQLASWGAEVGADVPFFVYGRPAWVEGVGEVVTPLDRWPAVSLVVAFPGSGVSTAEIYRRYDAAIPPPGRGRVSLTKPPSATSIAQFISGERSLPELLVNDLEAVAAEVRPELRFLKTLLVKFGAEGAVMTGSGSAVFGIWSTRAGAEKAAAEVRGRGIWAVAVETLAVSPAAA